ncbi:hypothetical protein KR009_008297 [Drosophila setifemur]|nr:hypothetical protein KR009_008297 [Drosophila setifemur]
MDWQPSIIAGLICLLLPSQTYLTNAWSLPVSAPATPVGRRLNEVSPYLDLALCPIRSEPWTCARQQSARILDSWDGELHIQWQKLKVEADRQMNATIERRGYSTSELPVKEKPSTILKKIEIGTNYMKKYLAESMDGFLGREYEYLQTPKAADDDSENEESANSVEDDDETDAADDTSDAAEETADDEDAGEEDDDDDDEEDDDASDSTGEQDQEQEQEKEPEAEAEDEDVEEADAEAEPEQESENEKENSPSVFSGLPAAQIDNGGKNTVFSEDNTSTGVEFIELQDGDQDAAGALKKPGGGKRKKNKKGNKKRKKNKKGQGQETQPATLVVVQAAPEHHEVDFGHDSEPAVVSHGGSGSEDTGSVARPLKQKRKQKKRMKGRRKRKGQHGHNNAVVEHEQSDLSLGLGLLDELADADDLLSGGGGKRKHRNPINYGRSNGVTRGKKKKKKKAIAKFMLIGSFLKAKIELLLKILGAHLQVKFFAIALIGLLINIARFWIDVKRGSPPSKVVYVEHAHHQHHYEDHGDDWSEQGSYWKRSLQTDPSIEDVDSSTDSYQVRPHQQQLQQSQDPHYLAYRNQHQWQ